MNLSMPPGEYEALTERAKLLPTPLVPQTVQQLSDRERTVQSLAKDFAGKPHAEILHKLGPNIGPQVIEVLNSKAPALKQILGKRQQRRREADAECGKALTMAGIQVQQHSVKDYTHVIVTQLDLLQDGAFPSVSAVVNAAFPDDPKKATSIKNSQHGKRRKQAYNSPAVMNHPVEKAMQVTHGRESMNRRDSARNFGQSLGINRVMFKSCDRITKLEARVQLLEQLVQATKNRETLADAGATSSRDKILSLDAAGFGPTDIARQLGMNLPAVKKALQRARKAG